MRLSATSASAALSGLTPSSDCSAASPPLRPAALARIFAKSAILSSRAA